MVQRDVAMKEAEHGTFKETENVEYTAESCPKGEG
jgi:hypothetical protein